MANFQRSGAKSNAHVGAEFEREAQGHFAELDMVLTKNFSISIGVHDQKKAHRFDLGSDNPKVLVECKSHKWTSGKNVPSAKMTVWNEAMYYFLLAPKDYRKIFFCLRDFSDEKRETLAEYYVRTHAHLIPSEVEIIEYDQDKKIAKILR